MPPVSLAAFGVTGLAEGVAVTVLITSTEVALGVE
jgi:hypothetical protein